MNPYDHMTVTHHFGGGVYTKQCVMSPGITYQQHMHNFDHLSILSSGAALVEVDGVITEHYGPTVLTIKANKYHSITPITEIVWYCIHATEETDPEHIDETLINVEATTTNT